MTRAAAAKKTSKVPKSTTIAVDGLRYTKKATGSPFVSNRGSFSGGTLSCLFCGVHRRSHERTTQRVFACNQQVCDPPCSKNPKSRRLAAQAAAAAAAGAQCDAAAVNPSTSLAPAAISPEAATMVLAG